MTWKFAPNSHAFAGPVSQGIFWSYHIISHPGWRFAVNKKLRWKGQSGIFLTWLGNSFEIPNRPTWPPKMFWLPQVTLKHLVGTYIFITQFVKSFPHRKTLNLPGVLSPSPDTVFGEFRHNFPFRPTQTDAFYLYKLSEKFREFGDNLQIRQTQTKNWRVWK